MRTSAVLIPLIALVVGVLFRYWPRSCLCHISQRLDGRVALVTDGPSFMGSEITAELARRGATVLIGCQSKEHFDTVHDKVLRLYGKNGERVNLDFVDERIKNDLTPIKESQLKYMPLHLNSLKSLKGFASEVMNVTDRLDFLINNAAVSHGPYFTTMDDYESTMAVGHLAHYLLTEHLRPLLLKTKHGARIIIISSAEHTTGSFKEHGFFINYDGFNSVKAFAQVKLANVVHGLILAQKFKGTSVVPVSVHPGYVLPDFGVFMPAIFGAFFKTPWEAGQSVLYLALAPKLKPGGYYSNCQLVEPAAEAKDKETIKFVRTESDRLIKLKV
ncbi:retinol dehydrogenase 11 [Echinococcus multilocularis]|uniref:Retinol dehydrogenase 11 n=1 Tax=Echinococcus multilocularis TaxID=6211 RepID=A0A068Y493_ECHMU|nr:retinol dehydrogenase 11 [Echinococcus multilocularis]